MASKQTPRGIAGNAKQYQNIRLRQWASSSYSATNGRAASSLAGEDNVGSPSTTHAENISRQIPGGFEARDARYLQDSTPVFRRPFTQKVD
jgi:hypothetical protein